mgnify:FL=1
MNELWTEQGNNFRMNISGTEYEVNTHFDSSGTVLKCETVPPLI